MNLVDRKILLEYAPSIPSSNSKRRLKIQNTPQHSIDNETGTFS